MDAVRCFVREQDEWDLYLAQILSAMPSSINRSTGFTPNRVMLGREVVTPPRTCPYWGFTTSRGKGRRRLCRGVGTGDEEGA